MVIKKKIFFYENITLKKVSFKDIEILRKERNSSFIRSKMLNQKIITKNDQLKWFKNIHKLKNDKYFCIYDKKTIVGFCSIKEINKFNLNCTWGFYVFQKFKGIYGPIIEYKILEYIFEKLKMKKIYGYTLSSNHEILKIHKFFGFRKEGVLKKHILKNKKEHDLILTSLFLKDWKNIKRKIIK